MQTDPPYPPVLALSFAFASASRLIREKDGRADVKFDAPAA